MSATVMSPTVIARKELARTGEASRASSFQPLALRIGLIFIVSSAICLGASTFRDSRQAALDKSVQVLEQYHRMNARCAEIRGRMASPEKLQSFAESAGMTPAPVSGIVWCAPGPRTAVLARASFGEGSSR